MRSKVLCLLAIFAAMLGLPDVSQGYWGSYYTPYQTATGVHFFPGMVRDPGPLPHFAVYPPVYYSQPIARTYGQYPFAYLPQEYMWPPQRGSHGIGPGCIAKAEVAQAVPLTISNPYVRGDQASLQSADSVLPTRIRNPFVVEQTAADTPLAAK